jgi:hypothetical protein
MKTIWLFEFFFKNPKPEVCFNLKIFQKKRTLTLDLSKKKEKTETPRFFDFRTRGDYITKSKNHTTMVRPHPGNLLCKGWFLYVSR